jgi:D-alanyl-D-alanine carboxypeptidase
VSGETKKLQAVLEAQIGRGNVHNIVAAVQSQDQHIDFIGAAGIADSQTGAAMTPETPYFIASVTKMYTAAIIMQLYKENCIDLNAPISQYLPTSLTRGIHVYKGVDYSERIKVSELVSQSSGLADHEVDKPRGGKSVLDDLKAGHDRFIDTAEALEIVRGLAPHFAPSTPGKAYWVCSSSLSPDALWRKTSKTVFLCRSAWDILTCTTGPRLVSRRFRRQFT